MKNLFMSALGTIALLAWWSWTGDDEIGYTAEDQILPAVVAGGGRAIDVSLHSSIPFYFSVVFACGDDEDAPEIHGREDRPPGDHQFAFDVSGECDYAILEAGTDEPPVGAELGWTVRIDGRTWDEEHMTLDAPLESGYGFFLQTGWEDGSLNEYIAYRDRH